MIEPRNTLLAGAEVVRAAERNTSWLIKFVEHRIGDKRMIRLIRKWLKAGVLEDGVVTANEQGTGQGAVILRRVNEARL